MQDNRYDVGIKYGLLTAQLDVALNGQDRDEVLNRCSPYLPSENQITSGTLCQN